MKDTLEPTWRLNVDCALFTYIGQHYSINKIFSESNNGLMIASERKSALILRRLECPGVKCHDCCKV